MDIRCLNSGNCHDPECPATKPEEGWRRCWVDDHKWVAAKEELDAALKVPAKGLSNHPPDSGYNDEAVQDIIDEQTEILTAALKTSQEKVAEQDGVIERLRESLTTVAGEAEEIHGEEAGILRAKVARLVEMARKVIADYGVTGEVFSILTGEEVNFSTEIAAIEQILADSEEK